MDTQSSIDIAIAFAKNWEKLASKNPDRTVYFTNTESLAPSTIIYAYPDTKKGYSIGWGTFGELQDKTKVKYGTTITKEQADNEIVAEIERVEAAIRDKITVELNEYQYAAILDYAYNAGEGALNYNNLIGVINSGGDVVSVLKKSAITINNGATVLSNLKNRRIDEGLLWEGKQNSLYSMYLRNAATIDTVAIVGGTALVAGLIYWYWKKGVIKI